MNFQVFHVNPGKKLKKKDVNNDLSHFMSVFPTSHFFPSYYDGKMNPVNYTKEVKNNYSKCHQSILDTL